MGRHPGSVMVRSKSRLYVNGFTRNLTRTAPARVATRRLGSRRTSPRIQRCGTGKGRSSAFDSGHVRLIVSVANGRREVVQPVDLQRAEFNSVGGCVLLDARNPPGSGDRSNVVPLSQQPGKCDLRRGGFGLDGHRLDLIDDPEIALEVLAHEPWVGLAPVVVWDVVHRDRCRQDHCLCREHPAGGSGRGLECRQRGVRRPRCAQHARRRRGPRLSRPASGGRSCRSSALTGQPLARPSGAIP